ncbi:MAG: DNA polymerase III subunit alpha [Rhodospirillaceae bacterium]|nr:DNA polymerase III subunit alpha [Rhodospirillaceae bacterium]OUT79822.1 MAG: DNA polymerase III subunit alpha [Rhodospirillaceae bacterium TMED23]|tara:strand:- start:37459 stop:40926 length:3468 start_codon:yes stop_codon:yes gene_type:complete
MSFSDFVHLRVHSGYSLLEGALKINELVKLAKDDKMPAIAITDTGNLFGALEFSKQCAIEGVQPIIGVQLDVTPLIFNNDQQSKNGSKVNSHDLPDQIVLLAKNNKGYRNILSLVSKYHLDPDGGVDPRISIDDLDKYRSGIIALTGGCKGGVGKLLANDQFENAEKLLLRLEKIFSENLYLEIQRHHLPLEDKIEGLILDLAYKHNIPIVATNECFFASSKMYSSHDALMCIADGNYVDQVDRERLTLEHRFKSTEEMRELFSDIPEALDNTILIAQRCHVMAEARDPLLPAAPKDNKISSLPDSEVLAVLAKDGLNKRLSIKISKPDDNRISKEYFDRLNYEINIINKMGFSGYFLIVADFIQWAKKNKIPVGPGRGSGAGSLVAWALTITDLDPLRFGLLFERFLNPERISMPDFDIDFCQERRDEVLRYVQEKYGKDRVAQIITFGTLQPRAALRDVGRVLQMPYSQVDRICKLVPNNPASPVTLQQAIDGEPALLGEIKSDEGVAKLVGIAKNLEGLYRHASTHAAGVVIGDRPLEELVPLYRDPRSEMPVTQFSMKFVESAGLVKFDFLGLKTLTVIAKALAIIEERGKLIDLDTLPLDDDLTFRMLCNGDTTGVFQLESSGMRDILQNMKPDSFEDIIAIVALYRPGPMDNIPSYILRKHGKERPDYYYPSLKPILEETYGIMIYQEQVMQIAQELAGYSLGSADILRRAMGKKIQSEMDSQRKMFVDGAKGKNVPEMKASEIFDQVSKFAGYGFNKSHAAAYALVSYQTAFLKANFPVEFITALMMLDMQNTDKLYAFKQELDRLDIDLLPPDINESNINFRVVTCGEESSIRYALAAIKNVGEGAMSVLISERETNGPYKNLDDFVSRLDSKAINKRSLENLITCGALDSLNPNRKQLYDSIGEIVRYSNLKQQERESNQIGLFGDIDEEKVAFPLSETKDWSENERLKEEFNAVGFFLSAHPLDGYTNFLEKLNVSNFASLQRGSKTGSLRLAGLVVALKKRISAKGNKYAFIQLSDPSASFELTIFSDVLAKSENLIVPGNNLLIDVIVENDNQFKVLVVRIRSLDNVIADIGNAFKIYSTNISAIADAKEILSGGSRGPGLVSIVTSLGECEVTIDLPGKFSITPSITQALKAIPGIDDVREV